MSTQSEEVKIVSEVSCKNSPKRELLRDLAIQTVQNDLEQTLEWFTEDVSWNLIGQEQLEGLAAVEEKLQSFLENAVLELHIHEIITHGKSAALSGKLIFKEKEATDFCHIVVFKSHSKTAKIQKITTYLVKNKQ